MKECLGMSEDDDVKLIKITNKNKFFVSFNTGYLGSYQADVGLQYYCLCHQSYF